MARRLRVARVDAVTELSWEQRQVVMARANAHKWRQKAYRLRGRLDVARERLADVEARLATAERELAVRDARDDVRGETVPF